MADMRKTRELKLAVHNKWFANNYRNIVLCNTDILLCVTDVAEFWQAAKTEEKLGFVVDNIL